MVRTLIAIATAAAAWFVAAIPDPLNPDPAGVRPIEAADTVFTEEMTWMEIRDALKAGKTTVIVATGGVEQAGPYLPTGKHNTILRANTEAIARKLGNALVAPIVQFVPEGNIDPPGEHMKYPGTISLTNETYIRLLTDICASLKAHGFENIVLIGDSGGNQAGLRTVAAAINAVWARSNIRVHYVPEYYDYPGVEKWLETQGIRQTPEGLHDDFGTTAQLAVIDPVNVRMKQRQAAGNFRINGVDLAPIEKTVDWGRRIVEYRADATVAALKKSMGAPKR